MFKKLALALALSGSAGVVLAAPTRFDFTFQEVAGAARATGYIVFETDLLANPGDSDIAIPDAAIQDLSVTVSGASSGNGTFGIADFCSVTFNTHGGTLDLSRELVGQPTSGDPWGTTVPPPDRAANGGDESTSGDFNLFACGGVGRGGDGYLLERGVPVTGAPNGVWWFTLGADGGAANEMRLVSMAPAGTPVHHAVPAAGFWSIAGLLALVAGFGVAAIRSRTPN
jgi:hypothetical protein